MRRDRADPRGTGRSRRRRRQQLDRLPARHRQRPADLHLRQLALHEQRRQLPDPDLADQLPRQFVGRADVDRRLDDVQHGPVDGADRLLDGLDDVGGQPRPRPDAGVQRHADDPGGLRRGRFARTVLRDGDVLAAVLVRPGARRPDDRPDDDRQHRREHADARLRDDDRHSDGAAGLQPDEPAGGDGHGGRTTLPAVRQLRHRDQLHRRRAVHGHRHEHDPGRLLERGPDAVARRGPLDAVQRWLVLRDPPVERRDLLRHAVPRGHGRLRLLRTRLPRLARHLAPAGAEPAATRPDLGGGRRQPAAIALDHDDGVQHHAVGSGRPAARPDRVRRAGLLRSRQPRCASADDRRRQHGNVELRRAEQLDVPRHRALQPGPGPRSRHQRARRGRVGRRRLRARQPGR